MTVRRKVFIILGLSVGLLLLATAGTTRVILSRNAEAQDTARVRDIILRLQALLANEIAVIDSQTNDYAAWDDTYNFIRRPNRAYIESNLAASTFSNNHFRFMIFLDTGGRIVQASAFDDETELEIPLPTGLTACLRPGAPLLNHPDLGQGVTGVLAIPGGSFLIASRPILTSAQTGPPAGTLVIGRLLGDRLVRMFGGIMLLNLTLKPAADLASEFAAGGSEGLHVRIVNRTTIEGNALIRDLDGRPAAALSFLQTRIFRAQFLRAWRLLLAGLLAFGVITLSAVLFLIDRQVTSRLAHLDRFVKEVEQSGDLGRRIHIEGGDE
ncbi:MAG: CHASE4 domain-containing protein, partial [Acidobacteriota bacterium]|nr:CHASE4 domain-containing protein [Acidobacteriota bacterium]